MFCIDKSNKITLTKGDTATMHVEIYDLDRNQYIPKSTDVIKFTMKSTASSAVALQKTATDTNHIIINPSDTSSLSLGLYVYDVQLTTGDGYVYTIIPTSFFQLMSEVS